MRNTDDEGANSYGDGAWEFRHDDFKAGCRDKLQNIRRKVPLKKPRVSPRPEDQQHLHNSYHQPPHQPHPHTVPHRTTNVFAPIDRASPYSTNEVAHLKAQVDSLTKMQYDMGQHLNSLTQDYQSVIGELVQFQRNMLAQDTVMQHMMSYLLTMGTKVPEDQDQPPEQQQQLQHQQHQHQQQHQQEQQEQQTEDNGFVPPSEAQTLISSYRQAARASFDAMTALSKRVNSTPYLTFPISYSNNELVSATTTTSSNHPAPSSVGTVNYNASPISATFDEEDARSPTSTVAIKPEDRSPSYRTPTSAHAPQQQRQSSNEIVFSTNIFQTPQYSAPHQQQPSSDASHSSDPPSALSQQEQQPNPALPPIVPEELIDNQTDASGGLRVFTVGHLTPREKEEDAEEEDKEEDPVERRRNSLRIRRKTFVPGWAVPPKVLLVEDDDVSRKLSNKFLQVFGCETDMAVDGLSAVNKMNWTKYDLVLMDIVMPNLDGVSATSLIRQFDPTTPIISMTSNVQSDDVMTYFSNGKKWTVSIHSC